jgi:hypothetical protein
MGIGKKELILGFEKSTPAGRPISRIRRRAGRPKQENVRKKRVFCGVWGWVASETSDGFRIAGLIDYGIAEALAR